jgi:hypothetical protein
MYPEAHSTRAETDTRSRIIAKAPTNCVPFRVLVTSAEPNMEDVFNKFQSFKELIQTILYA